MFSWSRPSGGRGNTSSSSSSSHKQRYTRQQHISSYLTDPTLKPSTRVVDVNSTYDTVFQTTDRHTLLLRVHMPSGSLSTVSAPKMTLVGIRAVHPWVDSKMRVIGYPPIRNDTEFGNSGLLLSQAVNAVVQQFQMHPPRQVVFVDKSLKDLQSHLGGTNHANAANANDAANTHTAHLSQQSPSPPSPPPPKYNLPPSFHHSLTFTQTDQQTHQASLNDITMPHIPPTFHAYDDMDRTEMMQLMQPNNHTPAAAAAVDKFIQPILIPLPCVQETEALRATLHEANASFADRTIQSSKNELQELYSHIQNLQSSLKHKIDTMNDLQRQQMELCRPMKTKDILSKLKKAKKEAYEESEDVASEWLDKARCDSGSSSSSADENADVDAFLEEFMNVRTLHHVRSAKMERIEKAM